MKYFLAALISTGIGLLIYFNFYQITQSHQANEIKTKPLEYRGGWIRSTLSQDRSWYKRDEVTPINFDIYEISLKNPAANNSEKEIANALKIRLQSMSAATKNKWFDFNEGLKSGFVQMDESPLHYYNDNYIKDGETLNPNKPEFLMYYPGSDGMKLTGVMYLMPNIDEDGPQFGGNLTRWHYHEWQKEVCLEAGVLKDTENCNGVMSTYSPQMIHVWFVDHPEGPFASNMCLPTGIINGWEGNKSLRTLIHQEKKKTKLRRKNSE